LCKCDMQRADRMAWHGAGLDGVANERQRHRTQSQGA
jgi:hypothetical protein